MPPEVGMCAAAVSGKSIAVVRQEWWSAGGRGEGEKDGRNKKLEWSTPHASVRERPGGVAHLQPNGVTRSRTSHIVYLGTTRARIAPGGPCRVTNIV